MSLSAEDVQAISSLLDEKLGRIQATERRRRRFWLWFWIVLCVLSSIATWILVQRLIDQVQTELAEANAQMQEAKLAYQAQLRRSATLQAERQAAEQASRYQSQQSQASHEAGLISSLFRMQAEAAALNRELEAKAKVNPEMRTEQDAIAQLDESLRDLERAEAVANSASAILMRILLRNTDPAHNTQTENLLGSEAEGANPPSKP